MKICESCGKEFEAKRSDAKYCSKQCRQRKSAKHAARVKRNSFQEKECICGKKFKGPNNQIYCSDDCKEWAQRLHKERNNDNRFDNLDAEYPFDSEDYLP
jgi:hypothetical protein